MIFITKILLTVTIIAIMIVLVIGSMNVVISLNPDCPSTSSTNAIIQFTRTTCLMTQYFVFVFPVLAIAYFFIQVLNNIVKKE